MSKITKRILSIILALVLAVSGVLSGIPGGGVVRGEETGEVESSVAEKVEDASTASLGADMDEWDVGAEVVGDVGSAFVEEKAEDNEEETLTDTGLGNLKGITSVAETSFDRESSASIVDEKEISSTEYNGAGTGLNGAVFTLDKLSGNTVTNRWTLTTAGTGGNEGKITSWSETGVTKVTGSDDLSAHLGDGTYQLYESTAPAGYAMHSGKISFTVTAGVLAITSDASEQSAAGLIATPAPARDNTDNLMVYHFVFENTAGTELPSTGQAFGLSRMGFASLGTVLLTAFVALYMYKKIMGFFLFLYSVR